MRTLKIDKREDIDKVIRSCKSCYVAFCDGNMPYVVPMNFALDGNHIILHMAQSGRKWDIIGKNRNLCITWISGEKIAWQDIEVGCSYRVKSKSVIAEGVAEIITDTKEKEDCMTKLMAQYSDLSFKFSVPSIRNVGVVKVRIDQISARKFGAKAITPWNRHEQTEEDD
jgi:nitroimidazol reductase NimA-like FMN-containing flavoprotein (pyridoxamine 5'-phosphate oxidase superfamily)